ncbi:molybdenum cofactor guanylyltransferase [Halobacterium sp. KA-4]|uniref:molybdenum cofactor guanylyltransferase n=1 Tax=Halobacterium sp. KA-4 TaxID=2896367 RepID=UPI001E590F91|nr:molybdenum cofactor guanylyltransferase [Halobacterium sp. KA-4]MCD2199338.1 molybdenum cofactor guanylyltransferase [Halobacterium sp. KA-4]
MRTGLVLAGGHSTRFGEADKSVATVDENPMVRRVAERIDSVTDELVVNCRDDQRTAITDALDGLDYRMAVDPIPDEGPVAGMRTGLRVARGDRVAVVACDMPLADPELFERLFERSGTAAVPRADGHLQPLHAVYGRHAARFACDRTLANGSRRLADALARLDPVVVDVASTDSFTNINTRDDLVGVRGILSR